MCQLKAHLLRGLELLSRPLMLEGLWLVAESRLGLQEAHLVTPEYSH
mgnify:CR=1 FL=1